MVKRRREFHYAETIIVVLLLGLTLYLLASLVFP
jgi:hypothetical protein